MSTSVYLRKDVIDAADRQRGGRPLSAYLAELILEREAQQSGVALPKREAGPIPALLVNAMVQHAVGFRRDTRQVVMDSTGVQPSRKVCEDLDDEGHGAPFSIKHGGELLPSSAQVSQGRHRLNPARCDGCVLVVRDAYSWC